MVTCAQIMPNRPTEMDGINGVKFKIHPHQHAKAVKQETRQTYSIEGV